MTIETAVFLTDLERAQVVLALIAQARILENAGIDAGELKTLIVKIDGEWQ